MTREGELVDAHHTSSASAFVNAMHTISRSTILLPKYCNRHTGYGAIPEVRPKIDDLVHQNRCQKVLKYVIIIIAIIQYYIDLSIVSIVVKFTACSFGL